MQVLNDTKGNNLSRFNDKRKSEIKKRMHNIGFRSSVL